MVANRLGRSDQRLLGVVVIFLSRCVVVLSALKPTSSIHHPSVFCSENKIRGDRLRTMEYSHYMTKRVTVNLFRL